MGRISDVPSFPIDRRGRYSRRRSPGISGIIQRGLRAIDYCGRSNLQIINYDGAYPSLFKSTSALSSLTDVYQNPPQPPYWFGWTLPTLSGCIVLEPRGAGTRSEDVEHV